MDALETAITKIAESRRTLQSLIISSESFDYVKAKEALKDLQKVLRELGKTQAHLEQRNGDRSNIRVVDFSERRNSGFGDA
jgi:hypothetical protein